MAIIVLLHDDISIKKIPIDINRITLGRSPECDIFIDDSVVSKEHAVIETNAPENSDEDRKEPDYYIRDLESTNHTYVNGEQIDQRQLVHNDLIRIGRHTFKFVDESKALGDKTMKLRKSWIPGVYYTKE